jgi:putative transposase
MMMIAFKGAHFERDVILWCVRSYVAYPISYRQIEEMGEWGAEVDHSTLHRWVLKYVPDSGEGVLGHASVQWAAAGD